MANVAKSLEVVHSRSTPRALLLAPPIYDFALYDLFLKPFALCRLGAWLRACGWRVRLVNGLDYLDPASRARLGAPRREKRGTGKLFRQVVPRPRGLGPVKRSFARYGMLAESLERELAREEPDLVLVSSGMTYWYPGVVEAIGRVRRLHPRAAVVLGGIYATLCPEHARRVSGADHVLAGDAWPGLADLLARLHWPHGAPWEEGAFWPAPEGNWEAGVLRLNRGCPLRCAYCASGLLCPAFRPGDPDAALAQLLEMSRRFGTPSFAFYDDALLPGPALARLLELILSADLRVALHAPNALNVRFLERPLARLLRRAGLREVCLGVESAQAGFHEAFGRKLDVRRLPETLAALAEAGFDGQEITAYILAGLPGQRWEEVEESLQRIGRLGIRVQVTEYSPVPGTALWPEALRRSFLPLAEEPLTHNNTLLPMQWKGFELEDLTRLKEQARVLNRSLAPGTPPG